MIHFYPSCIYLSPIISSLTESFLLCKFHFFSFFVIFFTYYSSFNTKNFICPFVLNGALTITLKAIYTPLYLCFPLNLKKSNHKKKCKNMHLFLKYEKFYFIFLIILHL